ncbi:jhy protein homolog [Colossoma macropomum]|uniref:jhy protein homolog n=1 Tax=Colossoma macropomum TaxID=42526 RepID=UPI0018654678|nr:jhy protein homolog [Colossoma macropomum]
MDSSVTERREGDETDGADESKRTGMTFDMISDASRRSANVSPNLWDSLESDTESLVQEKAYQRELQKRILGEDNGKSLYAANSDKYCVNVDVERSEYEDSYRETEQTLPETQLTGTKRHGPPGKSIELPRQSPPGDEYADLRYDPDWRRNLAGAEFLSQVQTSLSLDSSDEPGDTDRCLEDVTAIGRHEYVVVSNPALAEMDTFQPGPPSSSFHLHPQQNQFSHEDTAPSVPQSLSTSSENTPRLNSDRAFKARDRFIDHQSTAEISPSSSPRYRQQRDSNKQYDREDQSSSTARKESEDKLNLALPQRRRSQKVRQLRPREDIVERNKATLGMNTQKQGSYLKAYGQRGRKEEEANELLQPSVETSSIDSYGSPDNALDPELMWIQKTQKLKIHKEGKRSDGNRHQLHRPRPNPNPPVARGDSDAGHQPQVPTENQMRSPSDSGSISHPASQLSYPSAPTVNLSINLNAPGKLAEVFLGPELQQPVYALTPPPPPQWRIRPDVYSPPFIHPGYTIQQGSALQLPVSDLTPGQLHMGSNHLQGTGRRINGEPIRTHKSSSARIAPNWPPFEKDHSFKVPEVVLYDEDGVDSAHIHQAYSGGYAVLPPIGRSNSSDTELSRDRTEQSPNALHRSSSEGYLAQLEKQRQLKAKTTYKAYTLKDYMGLNQEVKLGGLGPSSTVSENVAEKIRRQKLYSNVIREQNKKISRIPFLPARNPVGSDNKDAFPRNKALEYAKTIAKPKAPQQWREKPKEKSENESVFERSAYLQLGVDLSQLATLEMLRKRHEQEKQMVARFTSLHPASSTPSVNTL